MSTEVRSGTWTPDDRAAQFYRGMPFEVPPGTARVEVRLDYDREAGVLDLGCSGADGFRGWSGGARESYVITQMSATPGYQAGPLTPGTWHVLLGLHRVADRGVNWRLTITVSASQGEPPSHDGIAAGRLLANPLPQRLGTARGFPAPAGWQWLAGDLHSHTVHSDGQFSVTDLARLAASRGLDFLAVTDHNTVSHHKYLPAAARAAGVVLVPGQEVTTDRGHANAFGDIGRIEFRDSPATWLDEVTERGGLLSVNHPIADDCAWRYYTRAPLAEVWHSSWRDRRDGGPLAWWIAGATDTVPVGGSDWHRPGDAKTLGEPTTWLLCREPSAAGVLDALAAGRVSITADPLRPALLRTESGLVAIDAAGLLLSGPGRGRVPVRGDRASWEADPGAYWLEDVNGTIMAMTGKESLL
jgi:hypothetical protein